MSKKEEKNLKLDIKENLKKDNTHKDPVADREKYDYSETVCSPEFGCINPSDEKEETKK